MNQSCKKNKRVSSDVKEFMINVPDVKEESITDYLFWKWRKLNSKFNYFNVKVFTRQKENQLSGADFELNALWLVRRQTHIKLVIQAKKLNANDQKFALAA